MGAGYVGILTVELHFPEAHSLKEKRHFVRSAKAQLQNRVGASVSEVDHHDVWQRARLTVACVAREHREVDAAPRRGRALAPQPGVGGDAGRAARCRSRRLTPVSTSVNTAMSERMRRVNESVRQVLAEAIPDLKDPRIGLVTVTGVDTAPDLRHATVFVSVLGSARKRKAGLQGLEAAHGLLQGRLARELRMKRTPQLTFEYDPSVERGVRMSRLIDELVPGENDADDD